MITDIIKPIKLLSGDHPDTGTTGQGCFMNVIAYLNGEEVITDESECVCYVIRPIAIFANDFLAKEKRQELLPFIERAIGSRTEDQAEAQRRVNLVVAFAKNMKLLAAKSAEYAAEYAKYAAKSAKSAKYAEYAAEYAKSAAEHAEYAARSAEYAAEYAEYAAEHAAKYAKSAEYAKSAKSAKSAEYAAKHAAEYAEYAAKYAAKSAKSAKSAEYAAEYAAKYAARSAKSAREFAEREEIETLLVKLLDDMLPKKEITNEIIESRAKQLIKIQSLALLPST